MGWYSWINFEMDCPNCGKKVVEFQTKDIERDPSWDKKGDPKISTYEISDCECFYSNCEFCSKNGDYDDSWIEFHRKESSWVKGRYEILEKTPLVKGFVMTIPEGIEVEYVENKI